MSIQIKNQEKKSSALKKLDEIRQNMADQDVGDDLLTLMDEAIEEIQSITLQ